MNIGDFDQLAAAYTDVAKALAAYHKALMANGFTRAEAIQIIAEYQKIALGPAHGQKP